MPDRSAISSRPVRTAGHERWRRARIAAAPATAAFLAAVWPADLHGQRLLRFKAPGPDGRIPAASAASVAGASAFGDRLHAVEVEFDVLREGPALLELATPNGGVLKVRRTVFEDRGRGNALWTGRVEGAVHDTVVLTLQNDRLVGTYGEPGSFKFDLTAAAGIGTVAEAGEAHPGENRPECEARAPPSASRAPAPSVPGSARPSADASPTPGPAAVAAASETSNHELDVLVLYTADAEKHWSASGVTAAAAVQAAVDYTNTVYRNGALGATLRLAHSAAAPAALSTDGRRGRDWLDPIPGNLEVKRLRERYEADVVILFMRDGSDWARCGAAYLRGKEHTAETISPWAFGLANLACHSARRTANSIFAHEIGHVLGGNHDPEGDGLLAAEKAVQPYAFGHTDTAPNPDIATIMSYGTNNSVREPWFSTVRVTPSNWNLGIADQRENERALKQTVASAARMSEYLPPAPPSGLGGTAALSGSSVNVSLTWTDNSSGETSFEVRYGVWPVSWSDAKVGATLAADTTSTTITGLSKATRYAFRVAAKNAHGASFSETWSVRTPGDGAPTAPGDLAGEALDSNRVRLTWTDNAVVETGYEVQYRTGTAAWTASSLAANIETATMTGLTAGAAYAFRVAAVNTHGKALSDEITVTTPVPAAPSGLTATATGTTSVDLAWTDNSTDETGFLVQYRASGATNWTNHSPEPGPGVTSASVTGLTAGVDYEFRVLARNGAALSEPSNVARLGALGAPSAPSGLSATGADSTSVSLSWTDNSSDETAFDVEYRTGGGAWTAAATAAPDWTSWTVRGLTPGTNHDFRVVARNASGSAASNVASRKTGPPAPSNLRARSSGGTWRLEWNDNSSDEAEFDVYYQDTGDNDNDTWGYLKSPPANSTSTDTGLAGQNYFFVVYAYVDSSRSSSPSNVATVGTFPRPAIPQDLAATGAGSTAATVAWTDNSANEGGFRVQHRTLTADGTAGDWTANVVAVDATSTTVSGLTPSGTYEFRVTAFILSTDTEAAKLSRGGTVVIRMPPAAPTGLAVTMPTTTSAALTWTDNATHETGFKVRYRERSASTWTLSSTQAADATAATVTGLVAGTDYEFQVVATNANGDSTPAVAATGTIDPPAAPSGVSVTPTGSTSATVSWTDNSSDEDGFEVRHRTLSTAWTTSATTARNAVAAAVSGLTPGTATQFRVLARNAAGATPSATVSRTMPPAAPSGLAATVAGPNSVTLSWTDESGGETGFLIQYKLSTATVWTDAGSEAANAESATVTGLAVDAAYDFRVLARHASNGLSSPSNVATLTTPGPPSAPSGLSATGADSTSARLSWTDNSSDETAFDVEYRTGGGAWTAAATAAPDWTSWTVRGLTPGTNHDFRVVARNASGSAASNVASRKTGPPAPSNLRARSSGGTWRLEWNDNSSDEAEFDVYYQDTGDNDNDTWGYLKSPPANSTSTDTGLAGQNYFFVVYAYVDSSRSSSPSNVATVGTFPRPAIPQDLAATGAGSTAATVAWTDNSANEGGFRVQHRTLTADGTAGDWTANVVAVDATSTTVSGLTPSGTYEFRVTAFILSTDTEAAKLSRGGTVVIRMPPAAPTGLAVTMPTTTSAALTWTDNATHETGFKIRYRERSASAWTLSSTAAADATAATVTGLVQGARYDFQVVATNANGDSTSSNLASTGPSMLTIAGLADAAVAENAAYASATPTVSGHRGAVTWTKEGDDAADFSIDADSGALSMIARDHEDPRDDDRDNVYEVTVKATDADGIVGTLAIAVTVTNVNEAPTFDATATLAISVPEGTVGDIGSPVAAADPEGAALAYSLAGTDAAAFQVSASGQISLATGTILNHEQKSGYGFDVVVSDGETPPLTATRAVTVTVTDVAESLTIAGLADAAVAENAAYASATPTVSGHRGAVTWTKEGDDAADFSIDSDSGALSMIARNHEDPRDDDRDNVYEVTVKATDADGIVGTLAIAVTVTNVNEAPTFDATATLAISVPEGTVGDIGSPVAAADPEGAALAYSLAGTDAAAFQVSASGQISLATGTILNHEQKSGYGFDVVVSDGETPPLTATRAVTVTVTDVAESLTIAGLADAAVAENAAYASATPTVSGHRGAVTWTKEGDDAADFSIDADSGALSMIARDHEDPRDDDRDNVYEVTVKATDADGIVGTLAIAVTVTNVNEAPTFDATATLAISVPEGTVGDIGSPVAAADPEGATLAYSLAGTDAASFVIDAETGQLSVPTGANLDYETKRTYVFSVVASDGETLPLTATRRVDVEVTDVFEPAPPRPPDDPLPPDDPPQPRSAPATNRPPEFRPATPLAISVPEGATGAIGAPVAAIDPDDDVLAYTLAGADAAGFDIDPGSAQISMAASAELDHGTKPFHVFAVVASDGTLTARREVAVLVIEPERPDRPDDPISPIAPTAPTGLDVALITSTAVLLTWSDNSDDETGFVVLVRGDGEDWRILRSLPANAETATIDGLDPAIAYEFLVTAVNAVGSAPSNGDTVSLALAPPTHLDGKVAGPGSVRLTWRDNSVSEAGFTVQYRNGSAGKWTTASTSGPNANSALLDGLEAGGRYRFRIGARGGADVTYSQSAAFTLAAPPAAGTATDCTPGDTAVTLNGGHDVRMCFQTPSGAQMDASNYHLEAADSGLLYFFDRDNVEVLVKVLDGCAFNGHVWVFVAPVTDLAFRLVVTAPDGRTWSHENPAGRTAATRTDAAAFACR